MFVGIVVCVCSRHALGLKMVLFRSFVSRKDYYVTIFHVGASQNYCVTILRNGRRTVDEQYKFLVFKANLT